MITKMIFTRIRSWLSAAALSAAFLSTPGHVFADTVQITTLTKPGGVQANVAANVYEGFSFATDASAYSLSTISVSLAGNGSVGTGALQADLYIGDHFGRPFGPSLGTFSTVDTTDIGSFSTVNFHPNAPITLLANTRYAFALSTAATTTKTWSVELTPVTDGFDLPAGAQWYMYPGRFFGVNGNWNYDTYYRARASVSANPIPSKGGHDGVPNPGHTELPLISFDRLGGYFSSGTAINESGQVVVVGNTIESYWQHSFLYTDGVLKDIGTLGGQFVNGMAINNKGAVAGVGTTAGELEQHPFVYSDGVMLDLGLLPGWGTSTVYGINDRGDVLGYLAKSDYSQIEPFLYSDGEMKEIGTLGGHYTFGSAINKSGQVVGSGGLAGDAQYHAFLYSDGVMKDLGTLGGSGASANAINDNGEIAGSSNVAGDAEIHPYLYSRGVMKDLGTIAGWTIGSAAKINKRGDVAGNFWNSNYTQSLGFIYSRGVMRNFGLPAGWAFTFISGMNDDADIVGYFAAADYSQMHGFIYRDGTLQDLNVAFADLLSDGTSAGFISLNTAAAINADGIVTGDGQYFDGLNFYSTQAFVLDTKAHSFGKKK